MDQEVFVGSGKWICFFLFVSSFQNSWAEIRKNDPHTRKYFRRFHDSKPITDLKKIDGTWDCVYHSANPGELEEDEKDPNKRPQNIPGYGPRTQ